MQKPSSFSISVLSVISFPTHDHPLHQTLMITKMDHTELSTSPTSCLTGTDILSFTLSSVSPQSLYSQDHFDYVVSQLKSHRRTHSIDTEVYHVLGTGVGVWETADTQMTCCH